MRFIGLLIIAFFISAQSGFASDLGTRLLLPVLGDLRKATDLARAGHGPDVKLLLRTRDHLARLEAHLNSARRPLPEEYSDIVLAYRAILNVRPLSEDQIQSLIADIDLKNGYFERTAGFWPFDKGLLVVVTVSTYRAARPEPGYTVAFTPAVDRARPTARFPFSSDTNDAVRQLPPGNYVMFLSRDGQRLMSRDVSVGSSGKEKEEVRVSLGAD